MGNEIMAYIQKLELFGFFSGYCLIYTIIFSLKTANNNRAQTLLKKLAALLPFSYALVATLYLGMVLKDFSLEVSVRNLNAQFQLPFLQIFGLLAVFFWIPLFSRKPVWSLLHSLVFFFFLLKDIFTELKLPQGTEIVHNDMKVFTDSLLLNIATLILITCTYLFFFYFSKVRKKAS
jgi:hypothetical protein